MLRIKTLVLLALTSTAALADAQTGPSSPINPSSPTQPAPVQSNILNAERLANYLRSQGHTVEQKRFDNGVINVMVKIQRDGWRYEMEIQYTADQKTLNFVVPLGQPGSQFSSAQLLALMKANFSLSPTAFSYREFDHRLCLIDPIWNTTNWSETGFQQTMDRILKTVRDTHPLWDSSRWPTNGQAPVTPTTSLPPTQPVNPSAPTAPVSPQAPSVPAVAQGLGNSSFVGSETLGSYGRLEFRFSGTNQVVMVDKDGQAPGTYTMQGNTVTIRFTYSNGAAVVYTGTINGQTLSGTATNGKDNWNFTVSK